MTSLPPTHVYILPFYRLTSSSGKIQTHTVKHFGKKNAGGRGYYKLIFFFHIFNHFNVNKEVCCVKMDIQKSLWFANYRNFYEWINVRNY